jgi:hypothetical protein
MVKTLAQNWDTNLRIQHTLSICLWNVSLSWWLFSNTRITLKNTPWLESENELYRPSLSTKLVPTFEVRGCYVVSVTDPYGLNLGFLDGSRYYFFPVAPQLYSRGSVDPVPDPLLLRKSDSAGNWTRTSVCSQELWPLDHRGSQSQSHFTVESQSVCLGVISL